LSRERPGSLVTVGAVAAGGAAAPGDDAVQRLQHPGGFLAAGDAQIEARFGPVRNSVRIVVAIVAALAAILLRHRRHHAPAQRAALRKLHAIGDRHGLVVPGRLAVIAIAGRALQNSGALLRRQWRRTACRQQAGKEAVEPGALGFREWRAGGNDLDPGRRGHLVHGLASASASLRNVAPSWRRANARKVSSRDERCDR
jgi:hypothetical protein